MDRRFLLTLSICLLLSSPAFAQRTAKEDVREIFCEAMSDPQNYDRFHYDAYKMLVPGKDGWIFRSQSDLRKDFTLSEDALLRLEEMNRAFKERGTELVMLLLPTRSMMHFEYLDYKERQLYGINDIDVVWESYKTSVDAIRSRGIHVVSIDRIQPGQTYFYKRDHHWTPEGAKDSARMVASYIKNLPVYADIRKTEYATHTQGTLRYEGVSKKVFAHLCGTVQPPEMIVQYVTEPKDSTATSRDLFGTTVNPDIVLLGTSNSTMTPSFANFEGFLKEELSADILNMSVSGGGLDTAMLSYLNSPFFREQPAKIAIWEIPGNYDLSVQRNFFRESVPAIYGSCKEPVDFEEDRTIVDKHMVVLDNLRDKKIRGTNYYLNFIFDQPVSRSFTADLRYTGSRDRYKFYRSSRTPNDNQFFLELKKTGRRDHLDKVVLYLPNAMMDRTVDVRLCQKKEKEGFFASFSKDMEPNGQENVVGLLHKLKAAIKLNGRL